MEGLLSRRAALQQKRGDLERKIRDLGSLPGDAFDKYRDKSLRELHRRLQTAQNELKKYGCAAGANREEYPVNVKALKKVLLECADELSWGIPLMRRRHVLSCS